MGMASNSNLNLGNSNSPQDCFNHLVRTQLMNADYDRVRVVTLAIWHEGFIPDVSELDEPSARAACYLIDKLRRFNCVETDSYWKLTDQMLYLIETHEISPDETKKLECRGLDRLAVRWGLDCDLRQVFRKLLPYQTRHYKHIKGDI
ncbi:conserved hypothetical protein [Vibrio chagasii]|nr:conserved hypothetical protein [Vibrio chagasii]